MKYEITFINKIQDGVNRDYILIFGETDIKSIAKLCFEYGSSGAYTGVKVKKVLSEKDKAAKKRKNDHLD